MAKRNFNFWRIGKVLLAIYIFAAMGLYLFQEKLIFLATTMEADEVVESAFEYEEVFLINPTDDAKIHALHFAKPNNKGVILYFHGNSGDLRKWAKVTEFFHERDFDVFVIDYRGYGKSTGKRSEESMFQDAELAFDYVSERYSSDEIIFYGRSLGGAFASYLSGKHKVNKVVLETPFYDLKSVANYRFPILPNSLLLNYKFENHKHLARSKSPVFIFHGTKDTVVPYSSGEKLFEHSKATNREVELITIPNGKHNDLADFPEFRNKLEKVLNSN